MGAVLSSAAVGSVLRVIRNCARRCLTAQHAATADWSDLPEDLLLIVMVALDIRSLDRCSAVCTSWRNASNTFRVPELKQTPCLLYACEEYGPSDAALYCPSTNKTFRVPFSGPPQEKRGFVFSCNGLVFAADEIGNPYLVNPITGVQAALPPVDTIKSGPNDDRNENFYDQDGKHVLVFREDEGTRQYIIWARLNEYCRVAISTNADVSKCAVLIVHRPECRLSYARPGDKRWTLVPPIADAADVLYNERDGLFYILRWNGSIMALDLSGPAPSLTKVLRGVNKLSTSSSQYLVMAPSGELLVVWRMSHRVAYSRSEDQFSYQTYMDNALEGHIEFAADDSDHKECTKASSIDLDNGVPQQRLDDEVDTVDLLVFKVDIKRQKLLELRDIGDHALFLGFNASICLPTKDLSRLEPNCAYLTDDCNMDDYSRTLRSDRGIWNIKKRSMKKLDDVWANLHSCLALPAPIWITPRF